MEREGKIPARALQVCRNKDQGEESKKYEILILLITLHRLGCHAT